MLIIDVNKIVNVDLYYKDSSNGFRVETASSIKDLAEEDQKSYSKLSLKMRPMYWKMYNTLQRESLVDNGSGQADTVNWIIYKEKKLNALIAEWNLKDDSGKALPVTPEVIGSLHPIIPEMILREYDAKTMSGE